MKRKDKVVLLGDGAVGKTSLVRRFIIDDFSDDYIATIGSKVSRKDLNIQGNTLTMMIWDVLGQHGYTRVQAGSFYGATGALLVADLTRSETIRSLMTYWIPKLRKMAGDIPVMFLANKSDLANDRDMSGVLLAQLAKSINSPLIITSAKTGANVPQAFYSLGEDILLKYEKKIPGPRPRFADTEVATLMEATDFIMNDFCQNFGDRQYAMSILRQHFHITGLDVTDPHPEGLNRLVELLQTLETRYLGREWAGKMLVRRQAVLAAVC